MSGNLVEAAMLAHDVTEICDLTATVVEHRFAGIVGLGFLPFASFVAVEAYDWLRRSGGANADPFLEVEAPRIRRLRARLKLLDDNRGDFTSAVLRLQAIEESSIAMFNRKRRFGLQSLRGRWQQDLGFYYAGPDLICTTHVSLVNTGYADSDIHDLSKASSASLGRELHEFAIEIGSFLCNVRQQLGPAPNTTIQSSADIHLYAEDHKARTVYPRINKRLGLPEAHFAAPLTWLISQVNYVHRILRKLSSSESDLYLRFRFLTAFHAIRGLQTMGATLQGERTSELGQMIAHLSARPGARRLRGLRRLRDALAHYEVGAVRLSPESSDPVSQLIEQFAKCHREELDDLLDNELEAMSSRVRHVLQKGTLGGLSVRLV